MKRAIFFFMFLLTTFSLMGQDIIKTSDGKTVEVVIKEIGSESVLYKMWSSQDGPDYRLSSKEIEKVILQNGEEIIYSTKIIAENMGVNYPDKIDYKHWTLVNDVTKEKLYDEQLKFILSEDAFDTYHSARRFHKTSMTLSIVGAAMIGVGTVFTIANAEYAGNPNDKSLIGPGVAFISAGAACVIVGIPFHCVGKAKLKTVTEDFNRNNASLALAISNNGVGFTLNF